MKIYIRKIMKHDLTHEVSLTSYVYYDFFEGNECCFFQIDGEKKTFTVTFNNATDLRFGGDFKKICRNLEVHEGDFLIIKRMGKNTFSISKETDTIATDKGYTPYFTGRRRHLIATIMDEILNAQYVR
jgi:hypothetical protein